MTDFRCRECDEFNSTRKGGLAWRNPVVRVECSRDVMNDMKISLEGVLTCRFDGHRWPIKLVDDVVDTTLPSLPVTESARLSSSVPPGIKQDVEESERDHFSQSYKSAVIMCRRALQLAIEQKPGAPQNQTLGPLLGWAQGQKLLPARVSSLAEGIKDYGDGGAHRPETFDPQTVSVIIHVTVEVLNELFP